MAKRKKSKIYSIMICTPGSQFPGYKHKLARIVLYDGTVYYAQLSEGCTEKRALTLIPALLGGPYNFTVD